MQARFKPLAGQVVVVSGAGSGIGLEAARLAAKAGAAVVLAGADEQAVRKACEEIGKAGGRCHPVAGDPATAEGCDRVARAAAARFGRIDSWIEAGGGEAALANAAQALVRQIGAGEEAGALVGFGRRLGKAARAELQKAKGRLGATMIRLPKDWRHDSPVEPVAKAALHAVTKPMGRMAVAAQGRRLTTVTEVKKHPGVVVGVGVLALVGVAVWFGRGRIGRVAASARPKIVRAVRPAVVGAVRRRPLQAAKLAAKYPRQALQLAKALR
ncbi:MAG: short-chain dehydrogenase/reductase [Phenylobacterium sp.]|jgi:NAD(P)-dependent dehydrogenase (short-subunit alcohol dehydrogenase family)|uniref:SDR family NAD(P)-dependent oxidoreductase n=1 Tax=Phenylobacterium sp. TaxID=1871053 RepID=UPI00262C8620|nr:SDR family NAD(P)-dependent oxidoreductase [Phenylobacterium sp.]MDB5426689.1 short-chain dehydrogenase/reductase [Phenylobacterium sp.]MDB5436161.1 short-chain dehydrogenase/reductase [Phenylobacterium sp.]MDB5461946.1 short-chain dehydrogenase/reductase [Phenylobacterium sp.]MDB5498557.1 short-chain dehydrogenase/reductase [Phenylobacterium sp.]